MKYVTVEIFIHIISMQKKKKNKKKKNTEKTYRLKIFKGSHPSFPIASLVPGN